MMITEIEPCDSERMSQVNPDVDLWGMRNKTEPSDTTAVIFGAVLIFILIVVVPWILGIVEIVEWIF